MTTSRPGEIRLLLSGGDRRSIADSNRVRPLIESNPSLVTELAALTADEDWLVSQRALDLLEKLAHEHADWIAPHKKIFIGPLAASDKWEIRLQIVRALPLFQWSPTQAHRVEEILLENVKFPQTFVRAWALDGLATLAQRKVTLISAPSGGGRPPPLFPGDTSDCAQHDSHARTAGFDLAYARQSAIDRGARVARTRTAAGLNRGMPTLDRLWARLRED